jgi:Xaa-Pro dipeptidase
VDQRLARAQQAIAEAGLDGWLLYDFQGKNPIFWQLVGQPRHVTRRLYLFVPRDGEPRVLCHPIDATGMAIFGLAQTEYRTWQELGEALPKLLGRARRVAMDYAPNCVLPVVSRADAGTVELVRSFGIEVVSSADLIQAAAARWSDSDLADHLSACEKLFASLDAAHDFVKAQVDHGITEHAVQQVLLEEFRRRGLTTEDPPTVAVNAHASDPHFETSADRDTPIRRGDWLLIDLWAREDRPGTVYADSTWVAFVGSEVPARHREVFDVVAEARDAAVERIRAGLSRGEPVEGWQVDRAARDLIEARGYGQYFFHRTGHSLGQQVHGPGVNLDDFETHDVRRLIPGVAVTVEPGIYLPEFGVRSEINVYVEPTGPRVTTRIQREVTLLG